MTQVLLTVLAVAVGGAATAGYGRVREWLTGWRSDRGAQSNGFGRRDFWLVVATVVVVVAGGFVVADVIYEAQSGSFFWHSIAFADVAAISTAVAAAAACVTAWVTRKPRSDGGEGVSARESELIREALARRVANDISPEEFSALVDAVVRLRQAASGKEPIATITVKSDDDEREVLEELVRRTLDDHAGSAAGKTSPPEELVRRPSDDHAGSAAGKTSPPKASS